MVYVRHEFEVPSDEDSWTYPAQLEDLTLKTRVLKAYAFGGLEGSEIVIFRTYVILVTALSKRPV